MYPLYVCAYTHYIYIRMPAIAHLDSADSKHENWYILLQIMTSLRIFVLEFVNSNM